MQGLRFESREDTAFDAVVRGISPPGRLRVGRSRRARSGRQGTFFGRRVGDTPANAPAHLSRSDRLGRIVARSNRAARAARQARGQCWWLDAEVDLGHYRTRGDRAHPLSPRPEHRAPHYIARQTAAAGGAPLPTGDEKRRSGDSGQGVLQRLRIHSPDSTGDTSPRGRAKGANRSTTAKKSNRRPRSRLTPRSDIGRGHSLEGLSSASVGGCSRAAPARRQHSSVVIAEAGGGVTPRWRRARMGGPTRKSCRKYPIRA